MEKEPEFTHTESLTVIQAMINKAKGQFSENGHLYLVWGWVILVCSIGHFVPIRFLDYQYASMISMLTWIVIIYQTY